MSDPDQRTPAELLWWADRVKELPWERIWWNPLAWVGLILAGLGSLLMAVLLWVAWPIILIHATVKWSFDDMGRTWKEVYDDV